MLGWALNLGFAANAADAPVVVVPATTGTGGGRSYRHFAWAPDPDPIVRRKITPAQEQELIRLVRSVIEDEDRKAKQRLEELATKYRDFENSLVAFKDAFSVMNEEALAKYRSHRISQIAYHEQKAEIEDEETVILHLLQGYI